ncbi:tRNA 2-thiouridine(34) synthase MnmA [Propionimicrobium sp. PCR01-08-3]|uniref:tRNA 2-thiouridine(34) synthase MnmA n=1 Tax=Propionimicrobium sp. PCR01-08-3 TaxID=3052086 RepID=UPI00255C7AEF|nr:tRNA 2-thiouridine(34) synthase MnmA [Propionimicrobium sp. PCR01-08-3]WIY83839.1 tRNA 2-thiouridine(34) synthase MnmA [Propionimicrobium sp. PCR01-08-3]
MRVLSAMSGGVDSSVATARLIAAGHQVTGVHLALSRTPLAQRVGSRGCCSLADVHDARRVADKLDIDFYVWDFSDRFADDVIGDFLAEYAAGRTPNPCLRCNERIKFAALLEKGIALGYDAVATGHYARLLEGFDGLELWRSRDPGKDQSYVLGVLDQYQLQHSLFPLGDSLKSEVREEAAGLGLAVASKPDSTDICFIPDGNTAGFLAEKLGDAPGEIVDEQGHHLGEHQGTFRYTIGQRKGLNLGIPAVDGRPRYVTGLDPESRQVVVGPAEDLAVDELRGIRPTWTGEVRDQPWRGKVQVRAHGEPRDAWIGMDQGEIVMRLDEGYRGVAPGQYAICYDGDKVIGSSVISSAVRTRAKAA